MNRRKFFIILTMFLIALILSGCGSSSLSGRFVNEDNSDEYLLFTSNAQVFMGSGGRGSRISGGYRLNDNNLVLWFEPANSEMNAIINDERETIYFLGFVFTLEGSLE